MYFHSVKFWYIFILKDKIGHEQLIFSYVFFYFFFLRQILFTPALIIKIIKLGHFFLLFFSFLFIFFPSLWKFRKKILEKRNILTTKKIRKLLIFFIFTSFFITSFFIFIISNFIFIKNKFFVIFIDIKERIIYFFLIFIIIICAIFNIVLFFLVIYHL